MGWQQEINDEQSKAMLTVSLAVVLDETRACCSGTSNKIANTIYKLFEPILITLPELLDMFHHHQTIVIAIFELLCEVIDKVRHVPENKLNQICIQSIQYYVKHNSNRISLESTAEEDSLDDLMLILSLSRNFLTIALFDTHGKICLFILFSLIDNCFFVFSQ